MPRFILTRASSSAPDHPENISLKVITKVSNLPSSHPSSTLTGVSPNRKRSPGVSKGNALLELADYLGIPADNTFAIGDSDNDLSMVESAKYGIAVGNATDEIKKAASFITANYDSLGFAKAVYEFVIPLVEKMN